MSKTYQMVVEAREMFDDGDVTGALHKLTEYADSHVKNEHTADIMHRAIDDEFGPLDGNGGDGE